MVQVTRRRKYVNLILVGYVKSPDYTTIYQALMIETWNDQSLRINQENPVGTKVYSHKTDLALIVIPQEHNVVSMSI